MTVQYDKALDIALGNYTVYKHTSPAGKVYIGITGQRPETRWGRGRYYTHSPHFNAAIEKYGWDNIQHEILATGLSKQEAELMEVRLIAEYKSTDPRYGYNADRGGASPGRASEATRRKMSRAQSGDKHYMFGKHHSEETKQKLREAHQGEKSAWFGKHHSEETKQKISTAQKGRQFTEEHRRKLSEARRGKHHSEETRRKISDTQKARLRGSEEVRDLCS